MGLMNFLPVDFFSREGKLTRWFRSFTTRTKKQKPSAERQAISGLLFGSIVVSVALVMIAWLFVAIIAPNLPATKSSLAKSERAAYLSAMALRNFLPGHDVRIERQFAYNLNLYVDRKPFEDIPYPDRKLIMAKIGRLWCDNIEYQWLAKVSVLDVRSGERLSRYVCAFGNLKRLF